MFSRIGSEWVTLLKCCFQPVKINRYLLCLGQFVVQGASAEPIDDCENCTFCPWGDNAAAQDII